MIKLPTSVPDTYETDSNDKLMYGKLGGTSEDAKWAYGQLQQGVWIGASSLHFLDYVIRKIHVDTKATLLYKFLQEDEEDGYADDIVTTV